MSTAREVSFYRVPLACEAAPRLGCGTRAKPVLQELERHPGIIKAWLNGAGNLIAIAGTVKGRRAALGALRRRLASVEPLRGEAREIALSTLASGSGWYRAAELDRLSEEEARAIARRLTARLCASTDINPARTAALENAVQAACARELIGNPAQSAPARKQRLAKAILAAARGHLDDALLETFADLVRLGHRPLPGED